jgi:hypothetical protein
MRPWHDFHIDGYAVDGFGREISFDLAWPYDTPTDARRARMVFEGVEAYFLEHDLGSNIVYDFAERSLRGFLEEWAQRFELSAKFGWPAFWRPTPYPQRAVEVELDDAHRLLTERNAKCIELASSYGLSGWVIAANVREEVRSN